MHLNRMNPAVEYVSASVRPQKKNQEHEKQLIKQTFNKNKPSTNDPQRGNNEKKKTFGNFILLDVPPDQPGGFCPH